MILYCVHQLENMKTRMGHAWLYDQGPWALLCVCIIEAAYLLSIEEFGFTERRASPPRLYKRVFAPGRDRDPPLLPSPRFLLKCKCPVCKPGEPRSSNRWFCAQLPGEQRFLGQYSNNVVLNASCIPGGIVISRQLHLLLGALLSSATSSLAGLCFSVLFSW